MDALGTWVGVVACCGVLVGCAGTGPEGDRPSPATSSGAATATEQRPRAAGRGVVVGPDGTRVVGEWEDGSPEGRVLVVGRTAGHDEVLYATAPEPGGPAFVAVGLTEGDRILRTAAAIPDVRNLTGIGLYGGQVLGERGPDELVRDGTYLLVGAVPAAPEITVNDLEGIPVAISATSTTVLPGFTVFAVAGAWDPGWDQVRLAPLTVRTDGGLHAGVREVSWTG